MIQNSCEISLLPSASDSRLQGERKLMEHGASSKGDEECRLTGCSVDISPYTEQEKMYYAQVSLMLVHLCAWPLSAHPDGRIRLEWPPVGHPEYGVRGKRGWRKYMAQLFAGTTRVRAHVLPIYRTVKLVATLTKSSQKTFQPTVCFLETNGSTSHPGTHP